jgi:hypothetical protein
MFAKMHEKDALSWTGSRFSHCIDLNFLVASEIKIAA